MTHSVLEYKSEEHILQAVHASQAAFKTGLTRVLEFRRRQLEQLWRMLDENTEEFCEALYQDLKKPRFESLIAEVYGTKQDIYDAMVHLNEWAKDERTAPSLLNRFGTTCIKRKEPKGTVLIIGAWNYPVNLVLAPLAGAIAAGCTAVVKPSELSPYIAKLLSELLPQYLDDKAFHIINGAVHQTTKLLEQKWDHIFYTGSGAVGKIIMKAAAENLTSVTLELGGKSPVIVDENADMTLAAHRILFGKMANAGQTCVAPDYVLITAKAQADFITALRQGVRSMFGDNPQNSKDLGRIVNSRHFDRLTRVLKENISGEVVIGGEMDEKDLYIAPTVVANVAKNDKLMQEEIFGPILPLVQVADIDDAIQYVNSKDEPLALYVFSSDKKFVKKVLDSTRSGGVLVNDTMMHVSENTLPFGGIGPSGMGNYHGHSSFLAFTHIRSTMYKNLSPLSECIERGRYAPYDDKKLRVARMVIERTPPFKQGFVLRNVKSITLLFVFVVLALIIFGVTYRRLA
ncbi:Aldehyde dehydrogenase [Mortierella sp. GBA30]|nr:Aldehyde dehydrogenase [Mortierella sp. GBA30]